MSDYRKLSVMSLREYVFQFDDTKLVRRIPYAKWCRIREGNERVEVYSNHAVYIAYAYILVEQGKPEYCPRIDGAIYYFDKTGLVIMEQPYYFDLLQDLDEMTGGVISLHHHKKKKEASNKYRWKLNSQQIQAVISCVW